MGYAARLPQVLVRALMMRDDVDFIEQDKIITLSSPLHHHHHHHHHHHRFSHSANEKMHQQSNEMHVKGHDSKLRQEKQQQLKKSVGVKEVQQDVPAWGLIRVSVRDMPENLTEYTYPDSAGSGVDADIIDTGVFVKHPEFEVFLLSPLLLLVLLFDLMRTFLTLGLCQAPRV